MAVKSLVLRTPCSLPLAVTLVRLSRYATTDHSVNFTCRRACKRDTPMPLHWHACVLVRCVGAWQAGALWSPVLSRLSRTYVLRSAGATLAGGRRLHVRARVCALFFFLTNLASSPATPASRDAEKAWWMPRNLAAALSSCAALPCSGSGAGRRPRGSSPHGAHAWPPLPWLHAARGRPGFSRACPASSGGRLTAPIAVF